MIRIIGFILLFLNTAFAATIAEICPNINGDCTINGTIDGELGIDKPYNTITNYATFINPPASGASIMIKSGITNTTFINYGNIYTFWTENGATGNVNVYNYGSIKNSTNGNFALSGHNVKLYYFNMTIDENADAFNAIDTTNSGDLTNKPDNERNSHILISGGNSGKFSLGDNATIMLHFGDSFEVDKVYNMQKLILDCSGTSNANNVQSCNKPYNSNSVKDKIIQTLATTNEGLYKFNVNGNNLSVSLDTAYASANALYKGNLLSINTIKNQLNSILYAKKIANKIENKEQIQTKSRRERERERRSQRYKPNEISIESSTESNIDENIESADNHYFLFSPFVSYQNLLDGGKYNGLGYGFVSGYNADLSENNLFGFHFGFMMGNLDSKTTFDFKNSYYAGFLGLHYQYSFVDSMYLRARLEAFYHYNTITKNLFDTTNINSISPSVSLSFGKKWDNQLGIETGIDYTAMMNSKVESIDGNYDKSFFNLAYFDINGNYDLILGSFALNSILGAKALLTPYPTTTLRISGGKNVAIHENRYSIYANIGTSWQINDIIALNLNYLGIFGDKMMSNSGFFNIKIWW